MAFNNLGYGISGGLSGGGAVQPVQPVGGPGLLGQPGGGLSTQLMQMLAGLNPQDPASQALLQKLGSAGNLAGLLGPQAPGMPPVPSGGPTSAPMGGFKPLSIGGPSSAGGLGAAGTPGGGMGGGIMQMLAANPTLLRSMLGGTGGSGLANNDPFAQLLNSAPNTP
jgi:hypothetical protein